MAWVPIRFRLQNGLFMEPIPISSGVAHSPTAPMKVAKGADHGNQKAGELSRGAKGMEQTTGSAPKLKIVVVEDDPTIRLFLKTALEEQLGHQVIGEAGTGTDMVRTVLDLEPDVVVFDIHLPR